MSDENPEDYINEAQLVLSIKKVHKDTGLVQVHRIIYGEAIKAANAADCSDGIDVLLSEKGQQNWSEVEDIIVGGVRIETTSESTDNGEPSGEDT